MKTAIVAAIMLFVSTASVFAKIIEVEMLNKNEAGDRMVFGQEIIRAEVGDTIRFLPTDKSHNAQSVKGALPNGQEPFRGKINKIVEYKVTETGLTGVVCLPHQNMGMIALVVVDNDFSNAEQILKARWRGKSKKKIKALIEEARASTPSQPSIPNVSG